MAKHKDEGLYEEIREAVRTAMEESDDNGDILGSPADTITTGILYASEVGKIEEGVRDDE